MKTDCVLMQVRHTSLDTVALGVWIVPGRSNWKKVVLGEGVWSCGRKKSRMFAQTTSHTGCNLFSGSFQKWLVTVGSSRGSSLGHLLSLWLLWERCCGRGTASGWEGRGRGQKEFCRERVMLSLELLADSPPVRWNGHQL